MGLRRPLLLYASPAEVKYVDYEPKFCIGVGATNIPSGLIGSGRDLILFGSCGLLGVHPYDEFIQEGFICVDHSIKNLAESLFLVWNTGGKAVEQESEKIGAPLKHHVRYVIDRCYKKCMPWGINHFWRIWQHRKMQIKFNKWIKEIDNGNEV